MASDPTNAPPARRAFSRVYTLRDAYLALQLLTAAIPDPAPQDDVDAQANRDDGGRPKEVTGTPGSA